MTVGQKASISLLASTILAAAFAVVSYSGLFQAIETGFYDPRARREVDASLDAIAAAEASYQAVLLERFAAVIGMDSFKRSFLSNQAFEDSQARLNALGLLAERNTGFRGARFVDLDGKRIHFSTFPADVAREESLRIVYRDYGADGDEPWSSLAVSPGAAPAINLLGGSREFVYRFPFVDGLGVHRGTALFYVSLQGLLEQLVRERLVGLGDDLSPVGGGLLLGLPSWAGTDFGARITELWSAGPNAEPLPVGQSSGSEAFILFSRLGSAGALGRLVPASIFEFPEALRWLMLAAFFVTAYLACFLLLNLRQDRMAALAATIKRLQLGIIEEYLDRKGGIDPVRLGRELETRRAEVRQRVRSAAGSLARKRGEEVDGLVDRSWDEIIRMLAGRSREEPVADIARIEALLREALSKGNFVVQGAPVSGGVRVPSATPASSPAPRAGVRPEGLEEAEAVEELEEAEEIEELEEAEAAEELEEAEVAEELEEAEAVPESGRTVAESADESEDLEELEEFEELEEAGASATAGSIIEAESREIPYEAETLEELEELDEAEEAEAVGPAPSRAAGAIVPSVAAVAARTGTSDGSGYAGLPGGIQSEEDLEELEELAEPVLDEEWGNLSAEALALASSEDEDVPLIPEGLGLELVEETDMADVIGYIGMNQPGGVDYSEDGGVSDVEEAPVPEEEPELDIVLGTPFLSAAQFMDDESAARLEAASPAEERARHEVDELLEEVEFDLFIGSLDLSGLEGYRDDEGFLEIGEADVNEAAVEEISPDADDRFLAEAATGEFSMLSDEDRERMEELQVVTEISTEEPEEAEALGSWAGWSRYTPHVRSFDCLVGEIETLIAFGDAEIGELAPLGQAVRDGEVIVLVDGVFTLNREAVNPAAADPSLKALADSVLEN